jgi:predicted phage terminase large subunit-like protein
LYGGAAGGAKSSALLMAALQYVSEPKYSKEWLMPTDAVWKGQENCWEFPSGAKLSFGYLDTDVDKYRYQSAEFQFIGFDELTQFTEDQYRYLFSRLRRLLTSHIPLRMRAASNPGGVGHDWVKQRFMVEGPEHNRVFIPAKLTDNPHIDQTSYIKSLDNLDPITRRQYLDGDWSARHGGNMFRREWFRIAVQAPSNLNRKRYWDKASTEPSKGKDPDYTVGVLIGESAGRYWILDVRRLRGSPPQVEALIKQTCILDNQVGHTPQYMEQEPGSSGVDVISHYAREVLAGYEFHGVRSTGSKTERAGAFSSAAEAGNITLLNAPWNNTYLDEVEAFPEGSHDDQTDASTGAFTQFKKPVANPAFYFP